MSTLTDEQIKSKLTEALNEPTVSPAFVERMVARANGITRGREAEKTLNGSAELPREQKEDLLARALIGRLMLRQIPPEGATVEAMEQQLKSLPDFQALAEKPANKLLNDLKNGRAILSAAGLDEKKGPDVPAEQLKAPEIAVPQREQLKL